MDKAPDLFFNQAGLDRANVQALVDESLGHADDGELFLEYRQSESFVFEKAASRQGCGELIAGFSGT